jgi:hypothetical protein
MTIQKALTFIREAERNERLRKSCYGCRSRNELLQHLSDKGYHFSNDECEDALRTMLLKCQTEEQAEKVYEWQSWFQLFPA